MGHRSNDCAGPPGNRGKLDPYIRNEPGALDVLLHFFTRQFTACSFENLRYQYPVARDGMFGEIGFDRELTRINWQLELRSFFCCFRCNRVPALWAHLLAPILDLSLAVIKLGCLAITFTTRNSAFFVRCRFSLF